jgi:hypothetical protein
MMKATILQIGEKIVVSGLDFLHHYGNQAFPQMEKETTGPGARGRSIEKHNKMASVARGT